MRRMRIVFTISSSNIAKIVWIPLSLTNQHSVTSAFSATSVTGASTRCTWRVAVTVFFVLIAKVARTVCFPSTYEIKSITS